MNNALLACSVGDIAWLKRCLSSRFDLSTTDKEGLTCLHLAAKNGHLDCLRHLLDSCRLDVNEAEATSGRTALHFSVSDKRRAQTSQRMMKLLIERGADPNIQSKEGWTVLHVAASNGRARCLKKLLEHGAAIHLTDSQGRTACDLATLHGHFDCARLLRSLHWARKKDTELKSELQEKTEENRRRHERSLIESRLKKEAADRAYQLWAQKKSKMTVEPPTACRERQESRTPGSCSSCTTSRRSSGRQSTSGKLTASMSVTMDQAKRNIECTGKPAKLHPYSNYPPRKQRRPSSNRASTRQGCTSRATNPTSSPFPAPIKIAPNESSQEKDTSEDVYDEIPSDSGGEQFETTEHPPSELNLGFLKNAQLLVSKSESRETAEDVEVQFLIGGVEEDEEEREHGTDYDEGDDEIAFHDVGRANSINSLSLPPALTKNRSVAEVIKLLRDLGSSGSGSQHSRHSRRRSFSCGLQRRFSLGAIPEGQMVTNYSNESVASLEEKSSWLRLPEPSSAGSQEEGEEREGEDEDKSDGQHMSGEEDGSDSNHAAEVVREERKTLKIVNLVWDTASSTVQTSVKESPMTPLNHSWHVTPPPHPRPSSPLTPPSPSSSSHHSTPPHLHSSPTPAHTPPPNFGPRPYLLRSNSGHFPTSSFSSELEDLQEAESSSNLIPPGEDTDKDPAPKTGPSLDQLALPAHSLFGSLMGGIASKSMISLTAANSPSSEPAVESESPQPPQPTQRRVKSAPNLQTNIIGSVYT